MSLERAIDGAAFSGTGPPRPDAAIEIVKEGNEWKEVLGKRRKGKNAQGNPKHVDEGTYIDVPKAMGASGDMETEEASAVIMRTMKKIAPHIEGDDVRAYNIFGLFMLIIANVIDLDLRVSRSICRGYFGLYKTVFGVDTFSLYMTSLLKKSITKDEFKYVVTRTCEILVDKINDAIKENGGHGSLTPVSYLKNGSHYMSINQLAGKGDRLFKNIYNRHLSDVNSVKAEAFAVKSIADKIGRLDKKMIENGTLGLFDCFSTFYVKSNPESLSEWEKRREALEKYFNNTEVVSDVQKLEKKPEKKPEQKIAVDASSVKSLTETLKGEQVSSWGTVTSVGKECLESIMESQLEFEKDINKFDEMAVDANCDPNDAGLEVSEGDIGTIPRDDRSFLEYMKMTFIKLDKKTEMTAKNGPGINPILLKSQDTGLLKSAGITLDILNGCNREILDKAIKGELSIDEGQTKRIDYLSRMYGDGEKHGSCTRGELCVVYGRTSKCYDMACNAKNKKRYQDMLYYQNSVVSPKKGGKRPSKSHSEPITSLMPCFIPVKNHEKLLECISEERFIDMNLITGIGKDPMSGSNEWIDRLFYLHVSISSYTIRGVVKYMKNPRIKKVYDDFVSSVVSNEKRFKDVKEEYMIIDDTEYRQWASYHHFLHSVFEGNLDVGHENKDIEKFRISMDALLWGVRRRILFPEITKGGKQFIDFYIFLDKCIADSLLVCTFNRKESQLLKKWEKRVSTPITVPEKKSGGTSSGDVLFISVMNGGKVPLNFSIKNIEKKPNVIKSGYVCGSSGDIRKEKNICDITGRSFDNLEELNSSRNGIYYLYCYVWRSPMNENGEKIMDQIKSSINGDATSLFDVLKASEGITDGIADEKAIDYKPVEDIECVELFKRHHSYFGDRSTGMLHYYMHSIDNWICTSIALENGSSDADIKERVANAISVHQLCVEEIDRLDTSISNMEEEIKRHKAHSDQLKSSSSYANNVHLRGEFKKHSYTGGDATRKTMTGITTSRRLLKGFATRLENMINSYYELSEFKSKLERIYDGSSSIIKAWRIYPCMFCGNSYPSVKMSKKVMDACNTHFPSICKNGTPERACPACYNNVLTVSARDSIYVRGKFLRCALTIWMYRIGLRTSRSSAGKGLETGSSMRKTLEQMKNELIPKLILMFLGDCASANIFIDYLTWGESSYLSLIHI